MLYKIKILRKGSSAFQTFTCSFFDISRGVVSFIEENEETVRHIPLTALNEIWEDKEQETVLTDCRRCGVPYRVGASSINSLYCPSCQEVMRKEP